MFYTYAHYTTEGRLFYIGKGHGRRAYFFHNRNKYWLNVVHKYGNPVVKILAKGLSEAEALIHEIKLIKFYKDLGINLCNMTDGGEGTSGLKLSDEHKQKISAKLKGRPGKKPSAETLLKLSLSHIGIPSKRKGVFGVVRQSPETIAKISLALKGRLYNVKYKYIGINKNTQESLLCVGNPQIKSYGFDPARVRDCANGKRKTHKGYTWQKEFIMDNKC